METGFSPPGDLHVTITIYHHRTMGSQILHVIGRRFYAEGIVSIQHPVSDSNSNIDGGHVCNHVDKLRRFGSASSRTRPSFVTLELFLPLAS